MHFRFYKMVLYFVYSLEHEDLAVVVSGVQELSAIGDRLRQDRVVEILEIVGSDHFRAD